MQTFVDMPGWTFDLDELSVGVYGISVSDSTGRRYQAKGPDPDKLLRDAREWVARIQKRTARNV